MNTAVNASLKETRLSNLNVSYKPPFTANEITAMQVVYGLLASIGFMENSGVIFLILYKRVLLGIPSNWFVLNLAIADAITCCILAFPVFFIGSVSILIVVGVCSLFAMLSSTGNLVILTFNRFLSVYKSLRYPAYMTLSRAKWLVCAPWILASIIVVIFGYFSEMRLKKINHLITTYYIVMILLISFLNMFMYKLAKNKRKSNERPQNPRAKMLRREHLLVIRLIIVNCTFFASCIPMVIMMYVFPTKESRNSIPFQRYMVLCGILVLLNAIIDPLAYSINQPVFKKCYFRFRQWLLRRRLRVTPAPQLKVAK